MTCFTYALHFNSALVQTEEKELQCNMEKDKDKKLNHHTAGIYKQISFELAIDTVQLL